MSNAVWKGVPLRNLIEAAGAKQGVVEVRLHGVDSYTDTFAIEKAMEPTTLVASEMNGEMIPARHGFPVRVIVPGLFGEKNVKWVTRIELVDHDAKGFYEQQGWGPNFVVPTTARFDVPDDKQKIKMAIASTGIPLRGVAHAGNRSVSRVEVSLDDGARVGMKPGLITRNRLWRGSYGITIGDRPKQANTGWWFAPPTAKASCKRRNSVALRPKAQPAITRSRRRSRLENLKSYEIELPANRR